MQVAEFFAGIGLVRQALEPHGFQIVWANDIDPKKLALYQLNFDASEFHLNDIRTVRGRDIPDIDLATASFPCTDLSLAGNRRGLQGSQSGMFWEFTRVLAEMDRRRPQVIMLENVPSFATSNGGRDLYEALRRLNQLGYWCDLLVIDARYFVPQSRPRLFVVGSSQPFPHSSDWRPSPLRPNWINTFVSAYRDLKLHALPMTLPGVDRGTLADIVERLPGADERWWESERRQRFVDELSELQHRRLRNFTKLPELHWATAYRRSRKGKPAWEIRADAISGCLRTARGGSSKQALVEAGNGGFQVRWMTAREYARLQGAGSYVIGDLSENQALFGFGDAVCVPVVAWIGQNYLSPIITGDQPAAIGTRQKAFAFARL